MKSKCVIRATALLAAALLLSLSHAQLKVPSIIGVMDTTVYIDDQSVPNEYFGRLYVGPDLQEMNVLYDTMSDWTVVTDDYEVFNSPTSKKWVYEEDGETIYNDIQFGDVVYEGPLYNETMCLIKHRDGKTRLCLKHYPFILSSIDNQGYYSYQGVLGLSHGEMNFMRIVNEEGLLGQNVVAFDYDTHEQVQSTVRFGVFDSDRANDGKLYSLPSVGHSKWVLKLDSVSFNGIQMSRSDDGRVASNVAFIDSGNTTMQFPMSVYRRIYNEIKHAVGHIRVRESYDFTAGSNIKILKIAAECDEIVDKLPTLKFDLAGGVSVEIDPFGYVYPPVPGDEYCKLGLSGVDGSKQYRLGTQFMKNFYTVLDYDNKKIMLGAKGKHATISGDESLLWQPPKPDPLPEPSKPTNTTDDDTTGSHTDDQTTKPDTDQGTDTKPDTDTTDEKPTEPKDDDKKPEQPDEKPDPKDKEPVTPDEEPKDEPKDHEEPKDEPKDDHKDTEDKPKDPPVVKPTDDKPKPDDKKEEPKPTPPTPSPPVVTPPAPAPKPKKKGMITKYIMDPIFGLLHLFQNDLNAFINLLLSPLNMLKHFKLF